MPIGNAMPDAFSSLVETFKNVAVSKAYGPAVQVAGEELIPVALVSFGFGGGSDPEAGDGNGAAGGGGSFVLPLGVYCRGHGGHVVFRPNTIALLAGMVPLVYAGFPPADCFGRRGTRARRRTGAH
jgi:uncharacterized spore protein YtfJ